MNIIFALIPLALMLLVVAVWAFFWAVKHEQFDDLDTPATRILFDDDEAPVPGRADLPLSRAADRQRDSAGASPSHPRRRS